VDNLPIELGETFCKPLAEHLKHAMPTPEVPHPVLPVGPRLALHFRRDETFSLPQKARPETIWPEHPFKLDSLAFSDPEPAVEDEPRRWQSLRRALHLGDDFLRDRSRSLLIARKVH